MKTLLPFVLIASILLNGCMATSGAAASNAPAQEGQYTGLFIGFAVAAVAITVGIAVSKSQKHQAAEAQFHACVGKTKAEIYTLYGPPDSIVDDGLADGGNILEYKHVKTTTNADGTVTTATDRKLFYLNKDNIVTSVKED